MVKSELLSLFIETLNLVLLPTREYDIPYEDSIEQCIKELEGDYYTFFHKDNVRALVDNGSIPTEFMGLVEELRNRISNINPAKWTVKDFISDGEWLDVRNLTIELFLRWDGFLLARISK
jgi:hypothetical protein